MCFDRSRHEGVGSESVPVSDWPGAFLGVVLESQGHGLCGHRGWVTYPAYISLAWLGPLRPPLSWKVHWFSLTRSLIDVACSFPPPFPFPFPVPTPHPTPAPAPPAPAATAALCGEPGPETAGWGPGHGAKEIPRVEAGAQPSNPARDVSWVWEAEA